VGGVLEKSWFIWEDHIKEEGYESGQNLSGTGLGLVSNIKNIRNLKK
jgi:hypothetical protein